VCIYIYIYIYIYKKKKPQQNSIPHKWTSGDAQLVFPGKTKLEKNVIKKKINVTRSLLDDIKTKQLQWYGQFKGWRRGDYQKKYCNGDHQGEENEADPNLLGRRGLEE
jgi:hypothetical protein